MKRQTQLLAKKKAHKWVRVKLKCPSLTCLQIALAFEGIAHKLHETTVYICSTVASLNTSYTKKFKIKITTFHDVKVKKYHDKSDVQNIVVILHHSSDIVLNFSFPKKVY